MELLPSFNGFSLGTFRNLCLNRQRHLSFQASFGDFGDAETRRTLEGRLLMLISAESSLKNRTGTVVLTLIDDFSYFVEFKKGLVLLSHYLDPQSGLDAL